MAKKEIKYGNVEFGPDEFADETASVRISMMLPMTLYKELKRLSLTEEFGGKYQVLAKSILQSGVNILNNEARTVAVENKAPVRRAATNAEKDKKKPKRA